MLKNITTTESLPNASARTIQQNQNRKQTVSECDKNDLLPDWIFRGTMDYPYLAKAENEKWMIVKQIIQSCSDLTPDYANKTLIVKLHLLSVARFNHFANELTKILNQEETTLPCTYLEMIFKITAK